MARNYRRLLKNSTGLILRRLLPSVPVAFFPVIRSPLIVIMTRILLGAEIADETISVEAVNNDLISAFGGSSAAKKNRQLLMKLPALLRMIWHSTAFSF